jgi:hypothetical protein
MVTGGSFSVRVVRTKPPTATGDDLSLTTTAPRTSLAASSRRGVRLSAKVVDPQKVDTFAFARTHACMHARQHGVDGCGTGHRWTTFC